MKTHTDNVQIIKQGGAPAFAVLPYDEYLELIGGDDENVYIPHEVAEMVLGDDVSLITAWRKYLKMSQTELANKMGITQGAVAQMEKADSKPHQRTLKNAAKAMGILPEQLSF
ncbi:TPA: helix-turn-helix domain-containing protein [Vibrio parahaemolyticus]|nr:helix-turn-helix transcriptional regulator [Vibrio alginolyticus]